MINIIKISKLWCGLLLVCGLLAIAAAPVHAADPAYNVSKVSFSESGATGQYYRVTADLNISWEPPTVAVPPMNYYLKFNTSDLPLSDLEFNNTVYDFKVAGSLDHTVPAIPKTTFDAYDYPQIHYLHIKTQFPTGDAIGFAFSEDVVIGPLLIDNRAPEGGTMTLNPASGGSRQVNITLSPLEPIRYYWLSESSTYQPIPAEKIDYGLFPTAVWDLQSTALPPVQVPIYVWFQDLAGNLSTTYVATANYNYTTAVAIVYNSSSVEIDGTLGFTVGGGILYNWEIIPSVPGSGVAYVNGTTLLTLNSSASLTVVGKALGTFTVSATPTAGGATLTTDAISVIQSTKTYNIPLSIGWNLISVPYQLPDTTITTVLSGIANKYSIVWGEFDPVGSGWKNYNPLKDLSLNSLKTMEPNKGYWINVTQVPCTLSMTGTDVTTKGSNLLIGWNLIGFAGDADTTITTVLSGIANKYSIVWGEFDPVGSGWKNYNPLKDLSLNSLKTMGPGKGYWINATDNVPLSY